jgi:endogenous inhibitor of DNA gyrase (YacG/DUF329 family)
MKCPICEREFDPAAPTAATPFCSERCKLIDLGRWLGEDYSFPAEREVDLDDESAAAAPEDES